MPAGSRPAAWVTNDPSVVNAHQFGLALWATQRGGDPSCYARISRAEHVTWNAVASRGH